MTLETVLEQILLNSIALGLLYGHASLGLSLVMGVLGVFNIAQGTFYLLGGYIAFSLRSASACQ